MPCQEKIQGAELQSTCSLYHEVILVTYKHAVVGGYATRFSLCGASTALTELWARRQASVPRPHSLPWSRLARSIYELCLAGACFASRFLLIIGCNMGGAQPSQKKTERQRQRQKEGSGVITQRPIIEIPNKGPRYYVLEIQNADDSFFDYALHVLFGLVICANISFLPSYYTSTLRRGR